MRSVWKNLVQNLKQQIHQSLTIFVNKKSIVFDLHAVYSYAQLDYIDIEQCLIFFRGSICFADRFIIIVLVSLIVKCLLSFELCWSILLIVSNQFALFYLLQIAYRKENIVEKHLQKGVFWLSRFIFFHIYIYLRIVF